MIFSTGFLNICIDFTFFVTFMDGISMVWKYKIIVWQDIQISGQSKFQCNVFISLFLTLWETLNNFFQVSWWPLACVWKWYRNHNSTLLFWIALGVFLSGHTFFQQSGPKTWWNFQRKTKIRTETYLVMYNYFQTTFFNSKSLACKSHDFLIWIKWHVFTGISFPAFFISVSW